MGLEVAQKVLNGSHINLTRIALQKGYSKSITRSIKHITGTKSYKAGLEPTLKRLEKEREDILNAMQTKDLTQEKYATLVTALDTVTKNVQLLSGGRTAETPQPLISINIVQNNITQNKSNE